MVIIEEYLSCWQLLYSWGLSHKVTKANQKKIYLLIQNSRKGVRGNPYNLIVVPRFPKIPVLRKYQLYTYIQWSKDRLSTNGVILNPLRTPNSGEDVEQLKLSFIAGT